MGIKAKNIVIWLVLLIIGVAMIVGPVDAFNRMYRPQLTVKTLDSKVPITTGTTTEVKDKNVKNSDNCKKLKKDQNDNNDPIIIKNHPVLKSPQSTK